MSTDITLEYLGIFDTVVEHIFNILHKDVNLPPFMDFANVSEANRQALDLHRQGLLRDYYNRIKQEAV